MSHHKLALVGALSFVIPGHEPQPPREPAAPAALRRRDEPARAPAPPTKAEAYYSGLTASLNPRLSLYEEKNPVIVVAEADKGDHKAEVIRVIESTYGKENPPRIHYVDTNLLDEEAAFTFNDLLQRQGVSPSSVRAVNYSMASWFDSSTPSSAMAMRRNIGNFRDTIFVHGAGNSEGGQPVYGLTTQSDHALVVGAAHHARHEAPLSAIRETAFTASSTSASSAVDMVMRGQDVPIDGLSGRWSKDKKDDPAPRQITGTSFAAPQVTALCAKLSARLRGFYIKGIPGQRFSDELSYENIHARDQRQNSFADMLTASIMCSAGAIHPGEAKAVVTAPDNRPFDTMGSGFGIPDFALAERIAFDQLLAAQLDGRAIPTLRYQAFAPENTQVFPRTRFEDAAQERAATDRNPLRYTASVRVPLPLEAAPIPGEPDAVAIDIPPFETSMTAQLIRGSLLCKVAAKGAKIPTCDLYLETPDGKTRLPLGSFSPEPKEMLFGSEKPHPIDDYRFINYRTRGLMLGETAPKGAARGLRLIIKARGADAAALRFFASGDPHLPVIEITGAPRETDMFTHHPAAASQLAFIPQSAMVESYRPAFEKLEDALDAHKPAQLVLEDFIEGRRVPASRVLAAMPQLRAAATTPETQRALGLMLHATVIEPVGRAAAERLMHLTHHYEATKNPKLQPATAAYTGLYRAVLAFEKQLVSGQYQRLPDLAQTIAEQTRAQSELLAAYAATTPVLFAASPLATQEAEATQALHHSLTGQSLTNHSLTNPTRQTTLTR